MVTPMVDGQRRKQESQIARDCVWERESPMNRQLYDVNIVAQDVLPTPRQIKGEFPLLPEQEQAVLAGRGALEAILDGLDQRLIAVVGPCSIHDYDLALDYARRLNALAAEIQESILVVMRVYFSKPRTTVGWKGFINDPFMDDSFRVDVGLKRARQLLLALAGLGLPAGTEALDPIIPQYLDDLITWNAIGARTTESQTHREMASGLSTAVGFKNATDGNIEVALNAMESASRPHHFLGMDADGHVTVMRTRGNPRSHIVLRGGDRPNYDSVSVAICEKALKARGMSCNIMIDCSHGNSFKDPDLQPLVLDNCIHQILEGNRSIKGVMLESNIHGGRQSIGNDPLQLAYGVSVTDACIDWETTARALQKAHRNLLTIRNQA
jgi:3-deoxy-7-phosphoheptulonate synthase